MATAHETPVTVSDVPLGTVKTELPPERVRLALPLAEIGLGVRTLNCLEERGIFTVEALLNCTREELLGIPNFGEKSLGEVYKALEGIGFFRKAKLPIGAA